MFYWLIDWSSTALHALDGTDIPQVSEANMSKPFHMEEDEEACKVPRDIALT